MMRMLGRLIWSKHWQRNAAALMSYGEADSSPGSWLPTGSDFRREFFWKKLCVKNCRSLWNGGLQEEMSISKKLQMWPCRLKGSLEMWLRLSGWEQSGISREVQKIPMTAVRTIQGLGWWHSAYCIAQGAESHPQPPHKQITCIGG